MRRAVRPVHMQICILKREDTDNLLQILMHAFNDLSVVLMNIIMVVFTDNRYDSHVELGSGRPADVSLNVSYRPPKSSSSWQRGPASASSQPDSYEFGHLETLRPYRDFRA